MANNSSEPRQRTHVGLPSGLRRLAVFLACLGAAWGSDARASEHLSDQVEQVFLNNCKDCHGPAGVRRSKQPKGGFDYVLDIDRLAESKLVVPGRPQVSRLFA